jgi:hypothetical protein
MDIECSRSQPFFYFEQQVCSHFLAAHLPRAARSRDIHACSCEETHLLMTFVKSLGVAQWSMHLDLHETTDSDLYEFRPAKASRDGVRHH